MHTGRINIIGIGPGNSKEYLTLKALETINSSDIGVYVGEMIGEDIKKLFVDKVTYFSKNISINELQSIIEIGYKQGKNISLMMPGDASIFSGQYLKQFSLAEYKEWFEYKQFNYEIIPGITSWIALNAKINLDITSHIISNNIYITSILWQNELEQFNIEKFESIISTKPCIVLYQSYEKWNTVKHIIEK
jgi:precorrin-4/cobalt-precorrin-4 C11-methyltransferase